MRAILKCGFFLLSMVLIIGIVIPAGAFAEKEIKIGVIYPLTGGAAAAGRELRAGAELAAEIANNTMQDIDMIMAQNAGIQSLGGAKIKLIFKDHEGNPTLGADLAKKLILDDKVDGLLGCYHSSVTKTVSAVAEQHDDRGDKLADLLRGQRVALGLERTVVHQPVVDAGPVLEQPPLKA